MGLMYVIVVVLIVFHEGPIECEKIPCPPNTHGIFCDIGMF